MKKFGGNHLVQTIGTFSARILAAMVGFLSNLGVTRSMGQSDAGVFFIAQSSLLLLGTLCRLGFDNVLLRDVAVDFDNQHHRKSNAVVLKAVLLCLAASVLLSLMGTLFSSVLDRYLPFGLGANMIAAIAFALPGYAVCLLVSFAIQGRGYIATSVLLNSVVFPSSILLFVYGGGFEGPISPSRLMTYFGYVSLIACLISLFVFVRISGRQIDLTACSLRSLQKKASPLLMVSIFSFFLAWFPQFMLAALNESADVARLTNAQRTAAVVSLFLFAANAVSSPRYAILHAKQDFSGLKEYVKRVNSVLVVTSGACVLILLCFAEGIMSLFDTNIGNGAWSLRILAISQFVNAGTGSVGYLLMMSGNSKTLRNCVGISAAISILCACCLIPLFGAIGAATSVAVASIALNLITAFQVHRLLRVYVFDVDLRFHWLFHLKSTNKD